MVAMRRALILLCFCAILCAEQVHPITGRRIAPTMSVDGADWLVRPEREAEEAVAEAEIVGDQPTSVFQ